MGISEDEAPNWLDPTNETLFVVYKTTQNQLFQDNATTEGLGQPYL